MSKDSWRRSRLVRTLGAAVACAAVALSTVGAAEARTHVEALHPLGHTESFDEALTLTTRGAAVALWQNVPNAIGQTGPVRAAVRRPGHAWSTPTTLGRTTAGAVPALTALSHGRAVAAWLNAKDHVVTRVWRPGHGWGGPAVLPGVPAGLRSPVLASNPTAHTWALAYVVQDPHAATVRVQVVTHRRGVVSSTQVGAGSAPSSAAVDDLGNVAVTWEASQQPEVSYLGAGVTTWVAQAIDDCTGFCADLQVFGTPAGLLLRVVSYEVNAGQLSHSTAFWNVDAAGHWTPQPGTYPFRGRVWTDHRGDLVSCRQEDHEHLWIQPLGGDWRRVDVPGLRVTSCAVNDHGRIVALGNETTRPHALALSWGRLTDDSLKPPTELRPRHTPHSTASQLVLSDSGVATGLAEVDASSPGVKELMGVRAVFSASAARAPAR
jgi:hypothetical protein